MGVTRVSPLAAILCVAFGEEVSGLGHGVVGLPETPALTQSVTQTQREF